MEKYFYRIKNSPEFKGIDGQRLEGVKITKFWREIPKKLNLSNGLSDSIEERIEKVDTKSKFNKEYFFNLALEAGFTEEELKGKTKEYIKNLIELDKTIIKEDNNGD